MGQSADQLRQEIEHKREDAAAKIDVIEARVQDTMQDARDTVQGTVQQARDTVVDTVEQTTQKVKESFGSFDFRRQVEDKPLLALGAALVGGFVLGGILGGDDDDRRHHGGGTSPDLPRDSRQGGVRSGIRTAARESGLEDTINNLASAFMGSMTERLRSVASENFPALADKLQGTSGSGDGQHSTGSNANPSPATTDTMGRPTPYFSSEGTGASNSEIPG